VIVKIDLGSSTVEATDEQGTRRCSLASADAFSIVSKAWLRAGWDAKYVYRFSWLGRPVIQLPEDLIRAQEVIYEVRPSVIVETGIAHGGSLVYYASLCRAMGRGRVIGVDIEIKPENRQALEHHPLSDLITLYEGDSADPAVVEQIRQSLEPGDTVMVFLDSNHAKSHVLRELELLAPLVSLGSYIVATDGIMGELAGAPRSGPDWEWNNPREAAREFVAANSGYVLADPEEPFNEGQVREPVTYWPGGWIRRVS